jgi:hypothetical protein
MKEKTFRNILDIAKKLELHVGFEQQIKHSGSSERKKTKLLIQVPKMQDYLGLN